MISISNEELQVILNVVLDKQKAESEINAQIQKLQIESLKVNVELNGKAAQSQLDLFGRMAKNTIESLEQHFKKMSDEIINSFGKIGSAGTILTSALNAIVAIGLSAIIDHLVNAQENARRAALGAASAYNTEKASIDEYVSTITILKKQLEDTNVSENESFLIKEQLLSIQNELVDSYGKEAEGLNLVNGQLDTQLELLRGITAENASAFLTGNASAIQKASDVMTGSENYVLGMYVHADGDVASKIKEIIDSVDGLSYDPSIDGTQMTIYFDGNPTEAERVITQFNREIRDLANNAEQSFNFDNIIRYSESAYNQATKRIEDYQSIYLASLYAKVQENVASAELYSNYSEGIQQLNHALHFGSEQDINEAAAAYRVLRAEVNELLSSSGELAPIFDDVQASLDSSALTAHLYGDRLELLAENLIELGYAQETVTEKVTEFSVDLEALGSSLQDAMDGINNLASVQSSLSENGFIDADALRTIINLYPEAVKYASDFAEMQAFIAGKMTELEHTALVAYGSMMTADAEAVTMMLRNHETLAIALGTYYDTDYQNFAKAANEKYRVDAQVVQSLSALWAQYAGRSADSIRRQVEGMRTVARRGILGLEEQEILKEMELYLELYDSMQMEFSALEVSAAPSFSAVGRAASGTAEQITNDFQELYEKLRHNLDTGIIDQEQYLDQLYELNEEYNKDNLELWRKYDLELYNGRKAIIEEFYDDLQKMAQDYGNAIIDNLNARISRLKDQITESDSYYDAQIQALKDQLSLLEKEWQAEDALLKIEKARMELERLKNQKTVSVYKEGEGFVWDVDYDAVNRAQESYDSLITDWERQQQKLSLQSQIEDLENAKRRNREAIEEQIRDIEKLRDKWKESVDLIGTAHEEYTESLQLAAEIEKMTLADMLAEQEQFTAEVLQLAEQRRKAMSDIDTSSSKGYASGSGSVRAYKYGTTFHPGGAAIINEEKAAGSVGELVVLPRGAGVIPASPTKTLWEFGVNPERFMSHMLAQSVGIAASLPALTKLGGAQDVHFSMGNITLNGVQNTEGLANAIVRELPNEILRAVNRRR